MKTLVLTIAVAALTGCAAAPSLPKTSSSCDEPTAPKAPALAMCSATETTSAQSSPLDGKKFLAHAVLPDGTAVTSELSFAGGLFDSSACEKLGFHAGRYTAAQAGDVVTFRAELRTNDGRSEVWTGRIEGDVITGDCLADGKRVSFQGRLA